MGWLIGPWLETLAWAEVRAVRSSRQRVGFYNASGRRSVGGAQQGRGPIYLLSYLSYPHIGFLWNNIWVSRWLLLPSIWSRLAAWPQNPGEACGNIKDSAAKPMGMCNNTQRPNLCFPLFYLLSFSCSLTVWFICNLFWNDSWKIIYCIS